MKKLCLVLAFLVCGMALLPALKLTSPGQKKDCTAVFPLEVGAYAAWTTVDRNNDGVVDYAAKYHKKGFCEQEAMDFNNDGLMDDFYIYEAGLLVRREVDSNYDGKIDLWAYMDKGMYLVAYEKDNDFDGIVDRVKDYGKK